jgi:hypothetical protein
MTPSETIISQPEFVVTDSFGRRLNLRRLTALDRLRLFKAAGSMLSHNDRWLGMAMLAVSVAAIDGIPIPQPGTEQQIEALVHRLGDAGIAAVAAALDPATAPRSAETLANAGNSAGTPT